MKECKKCKEYKSLESFTKNKDIKADGLDLYCISCKSIKRKINYGKHMAREIINYVYLLPVHNYVGTTNCISERMSKHRTKAKRDTSNYRILYSSTNRKDALELEELLHDIGYEGRHKKNWYR